MADVSELRAPAPVYAVAPAWFAWLYALAIAAHVVGNPPWGISTRGLVTLALGLSAATLVHRPSARSLWAAVAALQLLTVWLQMPVLGNHWLLMGFFSLAVLFALPRREPWKWLAPTVGTIFIVFYAFAAFAKLNSAFVDPSVSCGLFYGNELLGSWGLPPVPATAGAAWLPVIAALLAEISVVVLLLFRRTRTLGVALAAAFHFIISADLAQHFYDFTAVLFVGLAVLASPETTRRIEAWGERRRPTFNVLVVVWATLVVAATLPLSVVGLLLTRIVVFGAWLPLGAGVVWCALRGAGKPAVRSPWPPDVVAAGLAALVVLNGLTPYLGVKNATGFNMYSNLVTADGRSNHLLVRPTATLMDADYVTVVVSDSAGLQLYADGGWLVPERNLRHYLAEHPGVGVVFRRADGSTVAGRGAQLGESMPLLVRKLLPLRSIDPASPARCQTGWLPAL